MKRKKRNHNTFAVERFKFALRYLERQEAELYKLLTPKLAKRAATEVCKKLDAISVAQTATWFMARNTGIDPALLRRKEARRAK